MPDTFDAWFVREILAHEPALTRFLRRNWRHGDEVHDLRQEVYVRVYESARRTLPTSPRSYLFRCAQNLITDRLRRGRVVSIEPMGDFDQSSVLVDELSPERMLGGRDALRRLNEAFDRLPDRCRQVVWLRRVEELPQRTVAEQLGITEKTVEKHVAHGMKLMAGYLGGGGAVSKADRRATDSMKDDSEEGNNGRGPQHAD